METWVVRKNNFHDYSFNDWEETTPLLYFDVDFTITNLNTTHPDTELATPEYFTDATESDVPDTTQTQSPNVPVNTESESTPDVPTTSEVSVITETESSVVTESTTDADLLNNDTNTSSVTEISTTNQTSVATSPSDTHRTDSTEATGSNEYIETTISTETTTVMEEKDVLQHYLTTTNEAGLILTPPDIVVDGTTSRTAIPTVSPLILEVKGLMESLKYGYFTSLMITFMRVVASKEDTALEPLKKALHDEITQAQMGNRLDMFGQIAASVIGELSEMWSLAPSDFVKTQASFLYVSLTNRKTHYSPEVNAIFDLIDNAYTADDAMNVISCIADIEAFPNTTQSARSIASKLLQVAIFMPYEKIRGTTKDKLLLLEIENIITQRMAGPMSRRKVPLRKMPERIQTQLSKSISTRKRQLMESRIRKLIRTREEQSRRPRTLKEFTLLPINMKHRQLKLKESQIKRIRQRKEDLKVNNNKDENPIRLFDFFGTTKLTSTTDVDLDYLRNETIVKMLKEKMKLYKKKWKRIRRKENKIGVKRGKTTTTTTTTTTVKPTMRKSKYYIRKYVKKDLYRMKTTTPSTTTKKKWFRRRHYDTDINESFLSSSCSSETSCSNTHSIENIHKRNHSLNANNRVLNTRSIRNMDMRIALSKNNRKMLSRNKYNVDYGKVTKPTFRNLVSNKHHKLIKILRNTEDNNYSNDERGFKANVLDVLVHGGQRDLEFFKDKRRYNKMAPIQSNSNEETILKSNIYKALGYDNDFAAKLKT